MDIDGDRYYGGGKAEGGKEFQWKGIHDALLSRKVRKGLREKQRPEGKKPVVMSGRCSRQGPRAGAELGGGAVIGLRSSKEA